MESPKYLNEWMNDLYQKIDGNDKLTSQICAYMYGLMYCPWDKLVSVILTWETYDIRDNDEFKTVLRPRISLEFNK